MFHPNHSPLAPCFLASPDSIQFNSIPFNSIQATPTHLKNPCKTNSKLAIHPYRYIVQGRPHSVIAGSGAIRAAPILARAGLASADASHFSSQPQTVARKCAMLTRLARISIIHGCSSIRHGDARLAGSSRDSTR